MSMTHTEIGQAVTGNLASIRKIIHKTLRKYGVDLCSADIDDIQSDTAFCLLDSRMDNFVYTTEKKLQQWINYIAWQRCIDYLRALKINIPLNQEHNDDTPSKLVREVRGLHTPGDDPETAYLEKEYQLERRARLKAAVASLSHVEQRTFDAVAAIAANDFTVRAYAEQQGIKESVVHVRRYRLIKNLRKAV